MSSASSSTGAHPSSSAAADAVTKNALRYAISQQELELLQKYLLSKKTAAPQTAAKPKPKPDAAEEHEQDYNAATVRLSGRVFVAGLAGLKAYGLLTERLLKRPAAAKAQGPFYKSASFKLSFSIASILFLHRTLHRFFIRLRTTLATDDAKGFRARNPFIARLLTAKTGPAIGAALAGLALGFSPADQTRLTVTIYTFSRAVEFLYNHLEDKGWFQDRPWWLGSWLLMPLAAGQLLHAFVFDRDCFPAAYGSFILNRSPQYIQQRPADYPSHLPWPSTFAVVDALGNMADLRWPPFQSPILFPNGKPLPESLRQIAPITDPAHPAIQALSCAVLHPSDPSCVRTYVQYYLQAFPQMARFWTLVYAAFSLPRYKAFVQNPVTSLNALAIRILRTSFYLTSAIGTAWGSICFFQHYLPRSTLPRFRWFLSGFLAGCWAFLERGHGRSDFMYSARASLDSLWKVGKKKGWWRGVRNGDVLVFTASLMVIGGVYERNPKAVNSGVLRKALGVVRGEGWVDRHVESKDDGGEKKKKV